jgi:hypothetical protein
MSIRNKYAPCSSLNGIISSRSGAYEGHSRISHLVGAADAGSTDISSCRASISVDRHPAVINRAQTINFTLAVYFPAYPGNSAPAVWPQNSPGSAVGVREIFGDDTFGDPADNRRVEPAG